MAEMEQPTSDRVQALIPLVTDSVEKEILHRLQANLNQGARHNHDDLVRYSTMWYANKDEAEKSIEVERKRKAVEQAKVDQAKADQLRAEQLAKAEQLKDVKGPPHVAGPPEVRDPKIRN